MGALGRMNGLLDTNVVIAGLTEGGLEAAAISVMTLGELHAGVTLAPNDAERATRTARLDTVRERYAVLPIDDAVAAMYGHLRGSSRRRQTADLLIAATALAHELVLVTWDERLAELMPSGRSHLLT